LQLQQKRRTDACDGVLVSLLLRTHGAWLA
jgi:hypothetical protein